MSIKHLLKSASNLVNSILGVVCIYEHRSGDFTPDVHITIDRNKLVKDDNGFIAGYGVEATILISQIPRIYDGEKFTDDENNIWKIVQLTRQTSSKWYVDIVEVV